MSHSLQPKRDFVAELKSRINALNNPKKKREEQTPEPPVKRYNIHKRSLPIGIDKVVVFGVTKTEAEWWIANVLKTKCYQDDEKESKTIIYFEILPVDATARERSFYYNARPVLSTGEQYFEDKQPYPDEVPFVD